MSLQHELSDTSVGIPELNATVFGATQYPVAMWCECDTEHEILQYVSIKMSRGRSQYDIPCGLRMCEYIFRSEDVQERSGSRSRAPTS